MAFLGMLDYFELYDVPDLIVEHIFEYLSIPDLINTMSLCRRFYRIGKTLNVWKNFDQSNLTIGQYALHRLLERGVEKVRLSSAKIFVEQMSYPMPVSVPFEKLVHLDLSYATYFAPNILSTILDRTGSLKVLNIAQFPNVNDALCHKIARNTKLTHLNMEMCEPFSASGILVIMNSCKELIELNLGWARFEDGALTLLYKNLPPTLTRLNLSGMKNELTDEGMQAIVDRCPELKELDLSDCVAITSQAIKLINSLVKIKKVSLSRCFGIEPMYLLEINGLDELNIHGCVTDDGVRLLRNELHPTTINSSPLSTIARPSLSQSNRF